jgi:hypothetical protein
MKALASRDVDVLAKAIVGIEIGLRLDGVGDSPGGGVGH